MAFLNVSYLSNSKVVLFIYLGGCVLNLEMIGCSSRSTNLRSETYVLVNNTTLPAERRAPLSGTHSLVLCANQILISAKNNNDTGFIYHSVARTCTPVSSLEAGGLEMMDSVEDRDEKLYLNKYNRIMVDYEVSLSEVATTAVQSHTTPLDDGQTTLLDDGQTTLLDDGQITLLDDGQTTLLDDGQTTLLDDGQTTRLDDGQIGPLGAILFESAIGHQPPCPEHFQMHDYTEGSTCLRSSVNEVSYYSATDTCHSWGGHLAEVKSPVKLQLVTEAVPGRNFWVGLDDDDDEGRYVYQSDGSVVSEDDISSMFVPGQPQWFAAPAQDCIYVEKGELNDIVCVTSHYFLCEIFSFK